MAVVVGTNSWVTIAQADTYLTDRVGAADWFDLSDTDNPGEASKTTYLVTAFNLLMTYPAFDLSASLTAQVVKDAQVETALFLLRSLDQYEGHRDEIASGIESFRRSRWSEVLADEVKLPLNILSLLSDYSSAGGYFPIVEPDDYA